MWWYIILWLVAWWFEAYIIIVENLRELTCVNNTVNASKSEGGQVKNL